MAVVVVYSITAAILLAYFASYIYKAVAAVVAAVARSIIYIIVLLLLDKIMLVSELLRLLSPFYCCKSHKIMQNLATVSHVASATNSYIIVFIAGHSFSLSTFFRYNIYYKFDDPRS